MFINNIDQTVKDIIEAGKRDNKTRVEILDAICDARDQFELMTRRESPKHTGWVRYAFDQGLVDFILGKKDK